MLLGIKPPIWRRILVPDDYSFWDLHVAIQDAMGWTDCHLHMFRLKVARAGEVAIGIPDDEGFEEIEPGWETKVSDYLSLTNRKARYDYDFGDGGEHAIELEEIRPKKTRERLPACIGGRRACPPEDCGGPWGYTEKFLPAIRQPDHEEHASMVEWYGRPFDPERFDLDEVVFDSPEDRWKVSFQTPG